jgi:hypothetical protein
MASDLKWRTGFGWGSVGLLAFGLGVAVLTPGVARWLGLVVGVLALVFMVTQYRKWNGSPWRQLHFRALLAYSRIAGVHQASAQAQSRPFDLDAACRELGLQLCGSDKRASVDAMIDELSKEQGDYLANLFQQHVSVIEPSLQAVDRSAMADRLRAVTLGPQLVIANVLENTHGPIEATRYTLALLNGEAH